MADPGAFDLLTAATAFGSSLGAALASGFLLLVKDRRTRPIVSGVLEEQVAPVLARLERLEQEMLLLHRQRDLEKDRLDQVRVELDFYARRVDRKEGD